MNQQPGLLKRMGRALWFRVMLLQRGMTLGVRVIACNDAGEVLLVRHGYTPGWHLPGGGVDHHETLEEAGRRELLEETGYRAEGGLQLLGVSYNRRQWKGDHVTVYRASSLVLEREIQPGLEIAQIGFFATDALPEGTTPGTRALLAEWQAGCPMGAYWSG